MKKLKLIYVIYAFLILLIGYQLIKFKIMTKTYVPKFLTELKTKIQSDTLNHEFLFKVDLENADSAYFFQVIPDKETVLQYMPEMYSDFTKHENTINYYHIPFPNNLDENYAFLFCYKNGKTFYKLIHYDEVEMNFGFYKNINEEYIAHKIINNQIYYIKWDRNDLIWKNKIYKNYAVQFLGN